MERGWDPGVKRLMKKIITSVSLTLLWMMAGVTAGIYFELAYKGGIGTILFFIAMTASFILLIRYLYRTWKDDINS